MTFYSVLHSEDNTVKNENGETKYTRKTSEFLIVFYFIATILWLVLVMSMGVKPNDIVTIILIMVPVIAFAVAIYNAYDLDNRQHISKSTFNFFTVALLSTSVIVNWKSTSGNVVHREKFYKMLITGFIIFMLSSVDFWMDAKDEVYIVHVRTALQTISLGLIMIALFWYYVDVSK